MDMKCVISNLLSTNMFFEKRYKQIWLYLTIEHYTNKAKKFKILKKIVFHSIDNHPLFFSLSYPYFLEFTYERNCGKD